jgi:transcriptional regulator with XRE-family HTH domain
MNLSSHFKAQRLARSLNLGDLARLVGYRNIGKGMNRILRFEREDIVKEDLLLKIAGALGIDWATVEQLADQDRQEHIQAWNKWADEPVPMELVIRLMPAIYSPRPLPAEITTPEAAEVFACDLARQLHKKICLVVSRRKSVWINEDGIVENRTEASPFRGPNMPWMQIKGGRRFLFDFEIEGLVD